MPGRKLIATTVVRNPETQAVVTLRAGTKVPDWAEDQVGDHLFKAQSDAPVEPTSSTSTGGGGAPSGEPPRAGRGSSQDAWAEYAKGLDIEVPEDATRDDIIALVDTRNA